MMAERSILPPVFKLERYFAEYEFTVRHMLSTSDAQTISQKELLSHAAPEDLELWETLGLGYTESAGHPKLLSAIRDAFYPSLNPQRDILTCVPQEGIHIIMKCLIEFLSRDGPFHAIATYPAYQSLYEWLKTDRVQLSYWTADGSNCGQWQFDIDAVKGLVRPDTRLLVVNFPHNPTGYAPNESQWKSLVKWCHESNIVLFSDEMYRYTIADPDIKEPLKPACELSPTAITLCGLSKSFGMPGLRSGWLASQNKEIMTLCKNYKDYLTICGCAPGEILSIIAVKNHVSFSTAINEIAQINLKAMGTFMEEFHDVFIWRKPAVGLTGLIELRDAALKKFGSATGLADAVRSESEILVVPSHCMDIEDKYLRIGFGRRNFPSVLEVFSQFIRKHFNE